MSTHGTLRLVVGFADGREFPVWHAKTTPDLAVRLKRLFPQAQPERSGEIAISHRPDVARDLQMVLTRWPLDMSTGDLATLTDAADEHDAREEAVLSILRGERPHLDFMEPARPAREYQLVAADLASVSGRLLLADDLGLGKTMSGLLLLRNPAALPALVVCPTHLPAQWVDEIAKTLPWLRCHIVKTLKPYDPSKRRGMRGHEPDVLIMGYSKLRGWGDHLAGQVRTVIFDEVQELRRADSDKYVAAAQVADRADFRIGLTATPVYNYGGEIHNIMSVLAPDALGSRGEFAREWCDGGWWTDKVKVRDPAALGSHLRERGLLLRRTRKDVGRDLPEVIRIPHAVDADAQVHEQLMDGAIDLASAILEGDDRQAAFTAGGQLDLRVRHATGVSKAPYVAEFVRMLLEAEDKVVLFGWHRDVYDIWCARLQEFNPVFYTGTESPTQKQAAKDAFLRPLEEGDPDACRVFVMSLRSGAGLDGLQAVTRTAVFGELDWSPGMHDQCIGRLHRDGQHDNTLAYFLVSEFGSDPIMAEVLNVKRMQAEPLRDPDADLLETADTSDHVKQLAKQVLAGRKRRKALA